MPLISDMKLLCHEKHLQAPACEHKLLGSFLMLCMKMITEPDKPAFQELGTDLLAFGKETLSQLVFQVTIIKPVFLNFNTIFAYAE